MPPSDLGDDAFYGADRSAAIALVGHWMWPAHSKALGDDLVLLPMPRFGDRHVTGMGSWNWGIWSGSPRKEWAGKLLDFLMSEANVTAMSEAAGAEVIAGADPQKALDRAAAMIDQEIDLTSGYAPFGG